MSGEEAGTSVFSVLWQSSLSLSDTGGTNGDSSAFIVFIKADKQESA